VKLKQTSHVLGPGRGDSMKFAYGALSSATLGIAS
jgi:hypothetical protein